jgi:hypothetical protein
MVPSPKWFPQALGARADWYANFNTIFAVYAVALGFPVTDVDAVADDNAAFQIIATLALAVASYEKSMTAYRKQILEGDIGTPGGEIPPVPAYPVTLPIPASGLFERLDNLVKRIRLSATYTPEIGAALGIVPSVPDAVPPDDWKPDPSLRASAGNVVMVDYVRGQATGIEIQYMLDNSGDWVSAGRFTKTTANLQIPQSPGNLPRYVQVRARYLLGDTAVGQYSDIDSISTIP